MPNLRVATEIIVILVWFCSIDFVYCWMSSSFRITAATDWNGKKSSTESSRLQLPVRGNARCLGDSIQQLNKASSFSYCFSRQTLTTPSVRLIAAFSSNNKNTGDDVDMSHAKTKTTTPTDTVTTAPTTTTTTAMTSNEQTRRTECAKTETVIPAPHYDEYNPKKKLFSFYEARRLARGHGFSNVEEFLNYDCPGAYQLPKNPNIVWAAEWQDWDDWLGVPWSYEQAKIVVQMELRPQRQVTNQEQYLSLFGEHKDWMKEGDRSRLPFKPDLYYKSQWQGWDDFLGLDVTPP